MAGPLLHARRVLHGEDGRTVGGLGARRRLRRLEGLVGVDAGRGGAAGGAGALGGLGCENGVSIQMRDLDLYMAIGRTFCLGHGEQGLCDFVLAKSFGSAPLR